MFSCFFSFRMISNEMETLNSSENIGANELPTKENANEIEYLEEDAAYLGDHQIS